MKRLFLFVFVMLSAFVFAQTNLTETVYLSNGSVIKCNVLEQSTDSLKIQTYDGSIYVYDLSIVERIIKNDTKSSEESNVSTVIRNQDTSLSPPYIKGVRFNGYLDLNLFLGIMNDYGYGVDNAVYDHRIAFGQSFNFSLGVRIFDYVYVGFMSGVEFMEYIYKGNYNDKRIISYSFIPLTMDVRGYFPINEKIHPYIELAGGGAIGFKNNSKIWKARLGAGIDIKRLSLGVGWDYTTINEATNIGVYKYTFNQFYMKVGVKIGRRR